MQRRRGKQLGGDGMIGSGTADHASVVCGWIGRPDCSNLPTQSQCSLRSERLDDGNETFWFRVADTAGNSDIVSAPNLCGIREAKVRQARAWGARGNRGWIGLFRAPCSPKPSCGSGGSGRRHPMEENDRERVAVHYRVSRQQGSGNNQDDLAHSDFGKAAERDCYCNFRPRLLHYGKRSAHVQNLADQGRHQSGNWRSALRRALGPRARGAIERSCSFPFGGGSLKIGSNLRTSKAKQFCDRFNVPHRHAVPLRHGRRADADRLGDQGHCATTAQKFLKRRVAGSHNRGLAKLRLCRKQIKEASLSRFVMIPLRFGVGP